MDSAISTAARALSKGNPLLALRFVSLRDDGPALALRGIAMAQLGELQQARILLRRATKTLGEDESAAVARCTLARAEISIALRELDDAATELGAALRVLIAKGDHHNVVLARVLEVRRLLLLGDVAAAASMLSVIDASGLPSRLRALVALTAADVAARLAEPSHVESALREARAAAQDSRIPALLAEVAHLEQRLNAPVARLLRAGVVELVYLRDLETVLRSEVLLVDACRRELRQNATVVPLVTRAVLLELTTALALRAPEPVDREALILRAFGARRVNDSNRARLRVEMGRLRRLVSAFASVIATPSGFALIPKGGREVWVLLPPTEGESSALVALLRSGQSWPTSGLAQALGKSQRAVQRALADLEAQGVVQSTGRGRARRWVAAPSTHTETTLLLVAPGTLS